MEGMRNMFYGYACRRADDLEEMQGRLISVGLVTDGSDEEGDDELEEYEETKVHLKCFFHQCQSQKALFRASHFRKDSWPLSIRLGVSLMDGMYSGLSRH